MPSCEVTGRNLVIVTSWWFYEMWRTSEFFVFILGLSHSFDTTGKIKWNMCVADHPSTLLSLHLGEALSHVCEVTATGIFLVKN